MTELLRPIFDFIVKLGIDPLFLLLIFAVIIPGRIVYNRRDLYKNWNTQTEEDPTLLKLYVLGLFIGIIGTILSIVFE